MKKFYKLLPDFLARKYAVSITSKEEERLGLMEDSRISIRKIWDAPEEMLGSLIPMTSEEESKYFYYNSNYKPFHFYDIHNFSTGQYKYFSQFMKKPDGWVILVISPKVKIFLEKFNLPENGFYPIEVINPQTKEKRDFFLFHLKKEASLNLCYPAIEFLIKERGLLLRETPIIDVLPRGSINSFDDYIAMKEVFEKENKTIIPKKYIYKENYDVLCSIYSDIIVSERLRLKLDSEDFTGIAFEEWNKYEIITDYQSQNDILSFVEGEKFDVTEATRTHFEEIININSYFYRPEPTYNIYFEYNYASDTLDELEFLAGRIPPEYGFIPKESPWEISLTDAMNQIEIRYENEIPDWFLHSKEQSFDSLYLLAKQATIVSEKLKNVLERFKLPKHSFHKVKLNIQYSDIVFEDGKPVKFNPKFRREDEKNYYLMWMSMKEVFRDITFPSVAIDFITVDTSTVVKKFPKGSINSYEVFLKLYNEMSEAYPDLSAKVLGDIIFKRQYDLIFNGSYFLLSKSLREALVEAGLTGVVFKKWKNQQVLFNNVS